MVMATAVAAETIGQVNAACLFRSQVYGDCMRLLEPQFAHGFQSAVPIPRR
jgi:hypothetical protein